MTLTLETILMIAGILVLLALAGGELGGAFWLMDRRNHVLDAPDFGTRFGAGCTVVIALLLFLSLCALVTVVLNAVAAPADCPIGMPPAECGPDIIELSRVYLPGLWR